MKVMVIIKASQDSEAGKLPSTELLEAMGQFNQQLVDAGVMLAGEGLKPSSAGVRVLFQGDSRIVTDGPFAETKELIAGFWMWQVNSLQEAIDWVKKCPPPMEGEAEIEIRPIYEMDDFAENDPTGEIRAHEQQLRDQLEG